MLVLAAAWRTIHLDATAGGPLGIGILVEAAIDQMALGPHVIALLDVAAGHSRNLAIIGRPEAAIGHLHDTRVRIGGRGARLVLLGDLFLVGPPASRALRFDLASLSSAAATRASRSRAARSWAAAIRRLLACGSSSASCLSRSTSRRIRSVHSTFRERHWRY
jgi:hypothetical protein